MRRVVPFSIIRIFGGAYRGEGASQPGGPRRFFAGGGREKVLGINWDRGGGAIGNAEGD